MRTHATLFTLREINASVVLKALYADPPLSRAEVARRLGMTKPTVGNALELLLAAGLVRETAPPEPLHHGATYFEADTGIGAVLGLDIGGRYLRGALADLSGTILDHCALPLPDSTPETVCAVAVAVRDRLVSVGRAPIELAMVGVPGVVDPAEGVIKQSNPPELEGVALAAELTTALGVDTRTENDVMLAAQAEHVAGAGRVAKDFVFLSIGTGVGAGLVLDGKPYRGHRGAAGEVDDPPPGSEPDERDGSPSGYSLIELAHAWIASGDPTVLVPPVEPEHIFAAAHAGDPLAQRLRAEEIRRVAGRIAEIARVTDPELVVLGGGIGLAFEPMLPDLDAALRRLLTFPPRVEISSLGQTPVLVGATRLGAQLAWDEITALRLHQTAHGTEVAAT